jgi:hypothetical protein
VVRKAALHEKKGAPPSIAANKPTIRRDVKLRDLGGDGPISPLH